ncbi:hypothetical protein CsatA_012356 [Cannabis sativa]
MGEREEALKVVEIPGRGRSLVASQPLKGGQIVLKDSPIILYSALPLIPASSSYCGHCFRTLPLPPQPIPSCPNCNSERFCNHNCLSAASTSTHTPWLCQSLLRLRHHHHSSSLSLEHQLQARFLLAAHNLANLSSPHFQTLLSLQGQSDDPESAAAAQFILSLISSVCPPPSTGWFSLELSAALLAKDKLNGFGLMEPFSESAQRSVRAYGIYPKASLFNHDCLPNACRFDYVDSASPFDNNSNNTDIIVRMIHDVPQGREVCLSYFPVNENFPSRQKRLREDYGFGCDCDRCRVEAQWSDHEGEEEQGHGEEEEEEEEGEELMDEDVDQTMASSAEPEPESDFPHAYFFVRYMCDRNNCWGTLAPLPTPKSNVMECNVCGNLKNDDQQLSMDDA